MAVAVEAKTRVYDVASHQPRSLVVKDLAEAPKLPVNIRILYEDFHISGEKIAPLVGVSGRTLYNRLRKQDVLVRPRFEDPEIEERRVDGVNKAWRERKEELRLAVHTPDSDKKRSDANVRLMAEDPEFSKRALDNLERSNMRRRQKKVERVTAATTELQARRVSYAQRILSHPDFPSLYPRDRQFLTAGFPTDGSRPLSAEELKEALSLSISVSMIDQIRRRSLKRLGIKYLRHRR